MKVAHGQQLGETKQLDSNPETTAPRLFHLIQTLPLGHAMAQSNAQNGAAIGVAAPLKLSGE
jgi:hypothetical protein